MKHAKFDIEAPMDAVNADLLAGSRSAKHSARRAILPAVTLAAIWWALNPNDPTSWVIGAPAVVAATATVLLIPRPASPPIALGGALRFAGFFAVQTVVGATDVALRAFNPFAQPEPGFLTWQTHLPKGAPSVAFANAITLLPGTLTARIEGNTFTIHLRDTGAATTPQLAALEARIAAVFALKPETQE